MLKVWKTVVCFALVASAQTTGSSPCADLQQAFNETDRTYPESMVVSCMQTIPFNKNEDARKFWNKFQAVMQFHSDTAWLKDPPTSSYKQPSIDLDARMTAISDNIDNGTYSNQWDFEMDVHQLIHDTHEGHIFLFFGLTNHWTFSLPTTIIPVSMDGMEMPKLYVVPNINALDDTLSQIQANEAVPISQINGQDVVEYLTNTSRTVPTGNLETHTDWNELFYSAVRFINFGNGALQVAIRPWGIDEFKVTLEDGTTSGGAPRALFNLGNRLPTNLTDSDDWYNEFVVEGSSLTAATTTAVASSQATQYSSAFGTVTGAAAATTASSLTAAPSVLSTAAGSAATTNSAASSSSSAALGRRDQLDGWSKLLPAYPPADIVQDQFEPGGGQTTGYYLRDVALGVLSIPTFDTTAVKTGNGSLAFSEMLAAFIEGAKNAGMEKIIIDARGNPGGVAEMSTELFNNFFPQLTTWDGNRMRMSPGLNLLGSLFTAFWSSLTTQEQKIAKYFTASQWIATDFLNPVTGQDFSSWGEVQQGSYIQKGDNFTPTFNFDWSHPAFDIAAGGIVVDGYGNRTQKGVSNPWDPEDVVVLLDGNCASTCAMFSRKFSDVGVKTVVVGGLPQLGAMQGAAGVRGENSYTWAALNLDIMEAMQITFMDPTFQHLNVQVDSVLPNTQNYLQVARGSFNLRDEIEPNSSFPQQFAYLPADCRIFYTPSTYNNYENLWKYTAHAIWPNVGTTGSCLPNSTAEAIKTSPDATGTGSASANSTSSNSGGTSSTSQPKPNIASGLQYSVELFGILGLCMILMV